MKLSMVNHNLPYLVLVLCVILGAGLVYFTHGDMAKGVRRIWGWVVYAFDMRGRWK